MMAYARIPCHWQSWIGKSELARELTRRGVLAIDPDDDPGLAHSHLAGPH
jgi:hypothetical protein